jgi:hypothetical protein
MSAKKKTAPADLLLDKLASRPEGTRCVLVVEPDHLIEWGRTLTDRKGRNWEVVPYRGDDVVTCRAWQRAWGQGRPLCLVLTRAEGDEAKLPASSIGDLISRAEGEVIDLSLLGYFHALFPKVNPPEATLAQYRREFVENVEGMRQAYPRFRERWGEPDSWGRGHFLAILLLARLPALRLEDLWCNELEPLTFAAHAVWLLCQPHIGPEDLRLVAEVVWESSRHGKGDQACRWLDVPAEDLELFREELAAYLVLRDVLSASPVAHLDTLLRAKLLPRTLDPDEVGPLVASLVAQLKEHARWDLVKSRATDYLSPARIEKVADLLAQDPEALSRVVTSAEAVTPVLAFVVRQALLDRFQKLTTWPAWFTQLAGHALLTRLDGGESLEEADRCCASLLSAASNLDWVERSLATAVPVFTTPEQLLDWYIANRLHLLEFRVAEAFARLEAVDDSTLHDTGFEFVMKRPDSLRHRVRRFLNQLDRRLADFVKADPAKFASGPRSAIRIIPDVLRSGRRAANRRIWILVMDGMRYDTWDAVVRPLLMEHFEVVDRQDRPYFSLLPSKTDIARRGLLAAYLGKDWKNYFGKPTKDERILAARALGVSKQDADTKVFFVTDAETTEAREKLGYDPLDARDYNVLIYPISDDLGHYHNDTLAALNDKIRQQLRTQQTRRGIVDDLRRRVQAGDLVLITSDHGFQELFPQECVPVSRQEAFTSGASDEDVAYRYLRFKPKSPLSGAPVTMEWEELGHDGKKQRTMFTLAVGGHWFQREHGRPARFAHGGISLAEMTIPGVLLRPIEQKAARVELLALPSEIVVQEDQAGQLAFDLVNSGNVECRFQLSAENNLGEQLVQKEGLLPSGKRERLTCTVVGRYEADMNRRPLADKTTSAVFLTLAHSDLSGKMIRPSYGSQTVRVTVKPKPTKIDTDALKAFDDL